MAKKDVLNIPREESKLGWKKDVLNIPERRVDWGGRKMCLTYQEKESRLGWKKDVLNIPRRESSWFNFIEFMNTMIQLDIYHHLTFIILISFSGSTK